MGVRKSGRCGFDSRTIRKISPLAVQSGTKSMLSSSALSTAPISHPPIEPPYRM